MDPLTGFYPTYHYRHTAKEHCLIKRLSDKDYEMLVFRPVVLEGNIVLVENSTTSIKANLDDFTHEGCYWSPGLSRLYETVRGLLNR